METEIFVELWKAEKSLWDIWLDKSREKSLGYLIGQKQRKVSGIFYWTKANFISCSKILITPSWDILFNGSFTQSVFLAFFSWFIFKHNIFRHKYVNFVTWIHIEKKYKYKYSSLALSSIISKALYNKYPAISWKV